MLNINMVAVFAGVFLFFTKIRLPQILNQTFGSVGSMIGPASMMVTGMLIAEMSLKDIFTNGRVYFITFLRLIAVPAVALLLLKVSGLVNGSPDGKKLLLIVFLAVITPSASTITQMCQVYGNDSQYASASQCYDYIVFYCDDAAYGAFVPDDTLTKRKDQVLGIPGLFCIHMCIKGG